MGETVGEILKNARLQRSISLKDVSLATHIRQPYLEALESDQRELLPSEVQGRGFLRLYADYLHLPVEPLLAKWAGVELPVVIQDEPEPIISEPEPEPEPETEIAEETIEKQELVGEESIPIEDDTDTPIIIDQSLKQSQVIFSEVGATLKRQREKLGLNLSEVENYIHVRQHYLESIENGRMSHLPSPVQGRGMISNYAKFLQLDPDEILLRYAEGLQTHRLEKIGSLPQSPKHQAPTLKKTSYRRFLTPDLLVGSFLIIVLVGITIFSISQVLSPNERVEPTSPSISEVLLVTVSPTFSTTEENAAIGDETSDGEDFATQDIVMEPSSTAVDIDFASTISESKALNIEVVANQRAWVRVISDGKEVFNKRVSPGNVYQFSATTKLELTSGNASAIQVYFNQQDLGSLGIVGQVVNITFTKSGIQTPTALPTFTPTPTREFTPTPTGPTPTIATPSLTPFIP